MNLNAIKFFADYIEKNLGIIYSETNYFQLEYRLKSISTQLGYENIDIFYEKSKTKIDENAKNLIFDIATNNETSFFRDKAIFDCFSEFLIPEIIKNKKNGESIDIWSAASSSGQEAYSFNILYSQMQEKNPLMPSLKITASDISEKILEKAKSGIYTQLEVQRGLNARHLLKYFTQINPNQWKINESLQKNIVFKKINLLNPWTGEGPCDVIFCRNVLIYQNTENKKNIIKRLSETLKPSGYLIMGAAESLIGLSDDFKQIQTAGAILYQKKM